jgi:hypothetical protein
LIDLCTLEKIKQGVFEEQLRKIVSFLRSEEQKA